MYRRLAAATILVCTFTTNSLGHDVAPEHSCPRPDFAIDYADAGQLAFLKQEVDDYKHCVFKFVRYQEREWTVHLDAIEAATLEVERVQKVLEKHTPASRAE